MLIDDTLIGKVFKIKDVPQPESCNNCSSCLRLRIMELGLFSGEMIEITAHRFGLWIVSILSENGSTVSQIMMRDEEIRRIVLEDEECRIKIS